MSKRKNENGKPRQREDQGIWAIWKRWLRRNEKVLWVVLLILIAPLMAFTFPVTQFFAPTASDYLAATFYDEDVTVADVKKAQRLADAVSQVVPMSLYECAQLIPPARDGFDAVSYYLYKRTADRLGIRVSDEELGERIRGAWRQMRAATLMQEAMRADPTGNMAQQGALYQQKLDELEKNNAFDQAEWIRAVRERGVTLVAFESMLRDIYAIGKLQRYVENSVKVAPEEVFERFKKDNQKRKLSWVPWETTDELKAKIRGTISDETLETYYGEPRNRFQFVKPLGIRSSYVLIPKEHFESAAAASITDESLKEYYDEHRNDYRTTSLSADESLFALRSGDEQEKHEDAVYKPLEDVKDEVREKLLDEKADQELRVFADDLRQKLFPGANETPMTVEEVVTQFAFVKTGTTEYATRLDAEEVFGDVYDEFEIGRWFREAQPNRPNAPAKEDIQPNQVSRVVDVGRVFYTNVDVRPRREPELEEVRDEVLDVIVERDAVTTIGAALRDAVRGVGSDDSEEADEQARKYEEKLNSLLASGVEVSVGEEKLTVMPASELVTALEYAGRTSSLTYRALKEDAEDASSDSAETKTDAPQEGEDTEADDGSEEKTVPFGARSPILNAAFTLQSKGELGVAEAPRENTCFLVRFDDSADPDPADFEAQKDRVERTLQTEKQRAYVGEWRYNTLQRAAPPEQLDPLGGSAEPEGGESSAAPTE